MRLADAVWQKEKWALLDPWSDATLTIWWAASLHAHWLAGAHEQSRAFAQPFSHASKKTLGLRPGFHSRSLLDKRLSFPWNYAILSKSYDTPLNSGMNMLITLLEGLLHFFLIGHYLFQKNPYRFSLKKNSCNTRLILGNRPPYTQSSVTSNTSPTAQKWVDLSAYKTHKQTANSHPEWMICRTHFRQPHFFTIYNVLQRWK